MRDENGFPRRPAREEADAAISAIVRDGSARQAGRGKSKRAARQARIDANRITMRVDTRADLKAHLERIAVDLGVPVSQLVNRLIWEGLEKLTIDQLKTELEPTRSMRYLSTLPYPGDRLKGKSK